ncbi:MAG TPA: metalloregulator ArsR/SmtB family transcription factor [Gammaproteobacteria bacterium]|nr:metalloregulator ArsR/SmtB family transcription factor [Gammaproteobacteria bacterium]
MKPLNAVASLSALAQDTRLNIFRLLVQKGANGLAPGTIAEKLGVPNATLSFHLKELVHAGLIDARQDGRFIYYSANFDHMNSLVEYLTENCCGGQECGMASVPVTKSRRRQNGRQNL